eukprot:Unigene5951_Nuclearia_a/m.18226 Unigene5951_Nuclearia_a/g.18226  ORF Unigene5951_Nuclearia_a/g.18226 Unigene5951_Nuclearia_a/m.18226 type:complete len:334 (+) Unigene5951_Nuclearia_a:780-1781(+)
MQSTWNVRRGLQVSNVGRYLTSNTYLYAGSPNVWEAFLPGYTNVVRSQPRSPYTLGQQLYAQQGDHGIITGEYFGSQYGLADPSREIFIITTINTQPVNTVTRTRARGTATLDGTPVFTMTSFPNSFEDIVVNLPFFVELSGGQFKSVDDIPMRRFIIRLAPGLNDSRVDAVIASLPPLSIGYLTDVRGQFGLLVTQQGTIQWIFQIVTVFTLVIAFFSLSTSMFTNIIEQTKEVGILRALGLSRFPIFRIYIYEAFFLVISSAILGGLIGLIIGWSINAQFALLTQTPVPFVFPWSLAITVLIVAVLSAIFSTVLPVWRLVMMPVVGIFRLK